MNFISTADSTDFPVILDFPSIFQNYEQQLQSIRSQLLNFYTKLKFQDLNTVSDANLEKLYALFSELDGLAHLEIEQGMCDFIFQDPVIRSILPAIHSSYSDFFSLHETQLAHRVLASKAPWEMLKAFPLYSRYQKLISDHMQNSPEIKELALLGCGPFPVTLLLFNKLYGIRCIGVDNNSEAASLAKSCVEHFGLEKEITIIQGDENILSRIEWDSVLIAGLAEPKTLIFRNLRSIIKKQNPQATKPVSICYRNYTGMRQLLYHPFKPEAIKGFQKIKEICPSGEVNNTLVFLECI